MTGGLYSWCTVCCEWKPVYRDPSMFRGWVCLQDLFRGGRSHTHPTRLTARHAYKGPRHMAKPKCEYHDLRQMRTVMVDGKTRKAGDVYCVTCCKQIGTKCPNHPGGDLCDTCRPYIGMTPLPGEKFLQVTTHK